MNTGRCRTILQIELTGQLPPRAAAAVAQLHNELSGFSLHPGIAACGKKGAELLVYPAGGVWQIEWPTPAAFYRGLALLCMGQAPVAQRPCFAHCGIMLDCSRNAVPTCGTVQRFLRQMALMGLDVLYLYMEDTYEVPEQPYFGYLRGRFSQRELRELDDYADLFGIEIVPCIQTLAHLERALQWPCCAALRDTPDILMVSQEQTYLYLEQLLRAACAPFRSRRIHIGMDEAWGLGRGRYCDENGPASRAALMGAHLARVDKILRRLGRSGMMWSDMFFAAAMPGAGVYPPNAVLSDDILAGVPDDISLVYWDYYHETEPPYDNMLRAHARFPVPTVWAGGIWTWLGPAADYRKTRASAWPGLEQSRKHGIQEIFAAVWLDDGAECSFLSALYGMALYAAYQYTQTWDETDIRYQFRRLTGLDAALFDDITSLNTLPSLRLLPEGTANPCRMLLYEDPLLPLFAVDLDGLADSGYYLSLAQRFSVYLNGISGTDALFVRAHLRLAQALAAKCRWRTAAAALARTRTRAQALAAVPLAAENEAAMEALRLAWQALWMATCRPEGWEVLDIRLGGTIARWRSAAQRLSDFARGRVESLPELFAPKLPVLRTADGRLGCFNVWSSYVSACSVGKTMPRPCFEAKETE